MIELLAFVFRDFWTWAGTVVLLVALGVAFPALLHITINHRDAD